MLRAAAITLALVAATSAGHALAASGREVVNIDEGPGHRLVIVRSGGAGDGAWWSDGRDVLDYTDATGALVRVYADHPVSRADIESRLLEADRDAQHAQLEERHAVDGWRVAGEGRREVVTTRLNGADVAAEGRRKMQGAHQEAERTGA